MHAYESNLLKLGKNDDLHPRIHFLLTSTGLQMGYGTPPYWSHIYWFCFPVQRHSRLKQRLILTPLMNQIRVCANDPHRPTGVMSSIPGKSCKNRMLLERIIEVFCEFRSQSQRSFSGRAARHLRIWCPIGRRFPIEERRRHVSNFCYLLLILAARGILPL